MQRYMIYFQQIMLMLSIVAIPVFNMPKRFQILGIGGRLSFYFILLGLIVWGMECILFKKTLDKKSIISFIIFIGWLAISEVIGLITYPYYDEVNFAYSHGLSKLISIIQNYHISFISIPFLESIWLGIHGFKSIFFDAIFTFGVSIWVIHLFRDSFSRGFELIRKFILLLAVALGIYAIPEILLFKFHLAIGYDILSITNPLLYDVKTYMGWYPPLIWDNQQLRSYCTEPSIFGFVAASIIPMLWSYLYQNISLLTCSFYSYFMMLLFMTKARTATAIGIFDLCAAVALLCQAKFRKLVFNIILLSCTAFLLNIGLNYIPDTFLGSAFMSDSPESFEDYFDKNIKTITQKNARSNGSRFINMKAQTAVIFNRPIFGTGTGLKDCYIRDQLSEDDLQNIEIHGITQDLAKKGPLGASYGNVNHYIYMATNSGLVGLVIYLFPFIYVLYKIVKLKEWRDIRILFAVIALSGNLISQLAGEGVSLEYILLGLLYVGLSCKNEGKNGE